MIWTRHGIAAFAGFTVLALAGIALRPLAPVDETRYLAVAREMWLQADPLLLTRNFELYAHKPPLLFWAIDAVWLLTGVSETAARLIGPAFGLICIWLTGRLAGCLWPERPETAPRAMIALAGTLGFTAYAGLTMFDTMLTAATLAGLISLSRAVETGHWRYWMYLGGALAFGALAKGPVILVHLGPVMVTVAIRAGGHGPVSRRQRVLGPLLSVSFALAVVLIWLLPAAIAGGPEFRTNLLWTQTAGRVVNAFAHDRPWWFYIAFLPVLLFPWVWFPALWRKALHCNWRSPEMRLLLMWALPALAIFSLISGKQLHYIVPELAAWALIVARFMPEARELRVPFLAVLPVLLLCGVLPAAAFGWISIGDLSRLLSPAILLAAGLLMISLCIYALSVRGLAAGTSLTFGLLMIFNLGIGLSDTRSAYDSRIIADVIAPFDTAGIAFFGTDYNAEFNFAGRLTNAVASPEGAAELETWMRKHPYGVIVARLDRIEKMWAPHCTHLFMNRRLGIWYMSDAPIEETLS